MASILIIDDEPGIREMLYDILESEGYEVMEAPNGKAGIKLQNELNFDLVITDLIMPEKEGIETIIELKRDFPNVKIIAISGGGRVDPDNYLFTAQHLGADKTFAKPIDIEELLETIERLLKNI